MCGEEYKKAMETRVQPITGQARAKALSALLIDAKVGFTFAPAGPDEYEFTYKAEAEGVFSRCCADAGRAEIAAAAATAHGKNAIQGILVDALAEAYSTTAAAVEEDLRECGADEDLASICELMAGQGY